MQSGAYNPAWRDVHIGPERALLAWGMARGRLLLSVHWATFDLSLHVWTEPIERILVAAERAGVRVVTPRPGARLEPATPPPIDRSWPEPPWQRAHDRPIVSSGLGEVLEGRVRALAAAAV